MSLPQPRRTRYLSETQLLHLGRVTVPGLWVRRAVNPALLLLWPRAPPLLFVRLWSRNDQLCSTGLSWGANGGPAGQASAQGSLCGGSGCSCCHCCTVAGGPNEKRDLGRLEEEDVAGSPGAPCVTSMSRSASGAAPEPPDLAPVASGLWGRVRSCLASPRGCWVGHSSALGRCGFNQKNNLFASESDPDSFSQGWAA